MAMTAEQKKARARELGKIRRANIKAWAVAHGQTVKVATHDPERKLAQKRPKKQRGLRAHGASGKQLTPYQVHLLHWAETHGETPGEAMRDVRRQAEWKNLGYARPIGPRNQRKRKPKIVEEEIFYGPVNRRGRRAKIEYIPGSLGYDYSRLGYAGPPTIPPRPAKRGPKPALPPKPVHIVPSEEIFYGPALGPRPKGRRPKYTKTVDYSRLM